MISQLLLKILSTHRREMTDLVSELRAGLHDRRRAGLNDVARRVSQCRCNKPVIRRVAYLQTLSRRPTNHRLKHDLSHGRVPSADHVHHLRDDGLQTRQPLPEGRNVEDNAVHRDRIAGHIGDKLTAPPLISGIQPSLKGCSEREPPLPSRKKRAGTIESGLGPRDDR